MYFISLESSLCAASNEKTKSLLKFGKGVMMFLDVQCTKNVQWCEKIFFDQIQQEI